MNRLLVVLVVLSIAMGGAALSGASASVPEMPLVFVSAEYPVTDLAADGTYLYATTLAYEEYTTCAFRIFDVSSPTAPAEVGVRQSALPMFHLVVHPPDMFLTASYSGADSIWHGDVSDPSAPYLDSSWSAGRGTRIAFAADGARLVATMDNHLLILKAPLWNSTLLWDCWDGLIYGITSAGPIVYLAEYHDEEQAHTLNAVDVSDPPAIVSVTPWSGPGICSMAAQDDRLYLLDGAGTLRLWDVSSPTAPYQVDARQLVTDVPPMGPVDFHISIAGDYLVASLGSAGLQLLDISSPTGPAVIAEYVPSEEDPEQRFHRAVVIPPYVYAVAKVLIPIGSPAGAGTVAAAETAEISQICKLRAISAFPDLPLDHWAQPDIWACSQMGIVSGYPDGTYQPDWAVTRDQMAVYVARALAGGDEYVPAAPPSPSFPDVAASDVCHRYIEYAAANQIVFGYGDGLYHPEYEVDRGQMAVFIARATATPPGEPGMAGYVPPPTPTFADVTSDSLDPYQVCYKYVEFIADTGVTQGYPDGLYHPDYVVNRGLMAIYVARAFGLL